MFRQYKIGTRIGVTLFLLMLFTNVSVLIVSLNGISNVIKDAELRELRSFYNGFNGLIESRGQQAVMQSELVARLPMVQQTFADGDRVNLLAVVEKTYTNLRNEFGVKQFQFHLPTAESFLRVHKPEKFGDDLSSFRHTVTEVNASQKSLHGIEKGVAGLGIRGVTPVFHNENHLGSVEFGLSLGSELLVDFKAQNNIDARIYIRNEEGFKSFATTMEDELNPDAVMMENIMAGNDNVEYIDNEESQLAVFRAPINDYAGKPVAILELVMDRSLYLAKLNSEQIHLLMIGLCALVLGIIFSILLTRSIVSPLKNAGDRMDDIANGEGDLTQRLRARGKDELTVVARGFNNFATRIQELIRSVQGTTDQLVTAEEELTAITKNTSQGVYKQKNDIEQVANSITQMTTTVQEVATNASTAAEAANEAASEASAGKQVVDKTITSIQSLADEVKQASSVIHNLAADSEAISAVLDVIRGIADQTNLLALNAAIEAARAGENGRGFAVVADEVRTLAYRTQDSTQEIQSMIEKVQNGARNAVTVMESGSSRANDSVSMISEAGSSLETINYAVSAISDMNQQIATSAEQQSIVAAEINASVANIGAVADEAALGSEQTATASENLSRLGADLRLIVSTFKV